MNNNNIEIFDLKSDKFKTKTVNVFFCDELKKETASHNSLLVSVLKRGTNNYPTMGELAKYGQELYDTRVYSDVDKKGEIQIMSFTVTAVDKNYLKDSKDIFKKAVDLLYDVITDPLTEKVENGESHCFKNDYVKQEKANLCDLIESKINDKNYYASYRCFEEMCAVEPYSVDENGDKETIEKIENKELYEYYKNVFLNKLPIKIFITGNVDNNDISYVTDKFSQIKQQIYNKDLCTGGILPVSGGVRDFTEKLNVVQSKLCVGFRTQVSASSEEYFSLAVCNLIYGGGTESKLFKNVREKESMAYYIYSRVDKFKGVMIVSCGIEKNNKDRVLQLIDEQLEDIKNEKISDIEFDSAVNYFIDSIKQIQDGQRTLSEFYMGQMLCGIDRSIDQIIDEVRKVTRKSVAETAKKIQKDTVYFLTGDGSEDENGGENG